MRRLRSGWLSCLAIVLCASACSRSIHFPAAEVQSLRPLAGAPMRGSTGVGAELVTGAGQVVGLAAPDANVVLHAENETVLVDARTELLLHVGRGRELAFRPGAIAFGPTELLLDPAGRRRVAYPEITGLELERFSLGRTVLWTIVIGVTVLLTLSLLVLAAGGGGGGDGDDDDLFD